MRFKLPILLYIVVVSSQTELKYNVYQPINDFIKQKGFSISSFEMEKMAEISEKEQNNMGIENSVLVPSPMTINIDVKKIEKRSTTKPKTN